MFELIKIATAAIGSAVCGLWDLKTTEIPDILAIAMAVLGIGIHAWESYLIGNLAPLVSSLTVGGIFLLFSLIMYYIGWWGGGDGELLVAIGTLMPAYPAALFSQATLLPFPLGFFMNVFFIGAVYSIVYAAVLTAKDRTLFKEVKSKLKANIMSITSLSLFTLVVLLSVSVYVNFISYYPLLIAFLVFSLLVIQQFVKVVETKGFYKKIPSSKLRKGDMIGEDIPKLKIYKRFIRGLTEEEVRKIKNIKKTVVIREGVRFGPVFPLALLFTVLYGDIVSLLIAV